VSIDAVGGPKKHARDAQPLPAPGSTTSEPRAGSEPLDFVRFCYRRRHVSWPALYDEMCAVAARGAYRGLGYAELSECGISFCLTELPLLASLTELVVAEERARVDGSRNELPVRIAMTAASATG
jgi:hypothetical protein